MSLINVVVVLIVIGLLLYAANNWLPMDSKVKQILNVVVVIAVILWLLAIFFPGVVDVRVPTTRG
jgi:low temperature requirement protein LtrA